MRTLPRGRSRHATTALNAVPIASDTVTSKAAEFRWESERDIEKGGRERYASASRSKLQFNDGDDGHLVSRLLSSLPLLGLQILARIGVNKPDGFGITGKCISLVLPCQVQLAPATGSPVDLSELNGFAFDICFANSK